MATGVYIYIYMYIGCGCDWAPNKIYG